MENQDTKAVSGSEQKFERIPLDKRQSTASVAFVWMGAVVCVPILATGAMLITQVNFTTLLLLCIVGFLVPAILISLNGIAGSDQGLPITVLLSKSMGTKGSRFIGALAMSINVTGSFALQVVFCAGAFSALLKSVWDFDFPFWISALFWGGLMLITAIRGFSWMKWLNYIAMPFLAIVSLYATFVSLNTLGGCLRC